MKKSKVLSLPFPGGTSVKNPPAVQEMRVQSLGREDPLETEMATHSSDLAWRIPWKEEPDGPQSTESHRVGKDNPSLVVIVILE